MIELKPSQFIPSTAIDAAYDMLYADCASKTAVIKRLRKALILSKEKLNLYYKRSAEYVGGLEFSHLMQMIDEALEEKK